MSFAKALNLGRFPVALEITPPQRAMPSVLLRRARLLDGSATAINVIQRPDRQSSLDAAIALLIEGFEPVWHLVTRGRAEDELRRDITRACDAGIRNVLCIRGDQPAAPGTGSLTVRRAVELVREGIPDCSVGVTLNQYAPDLDAAFRNLMPRLAAGASYIQTQPAFDVDCLRPVAARLATTAPETRMVAMVMPLLSSEALDRIERRLGIPISAAVRRRVVEAGEDGAWDFFAETLRALATCGFVHGLAIMTFEMDPPPATAQRLLAVLERAGLGEGVRSRTGAAE